MNADDTRKILLLRRELTGETFNDSTLDAWHVALRSWSLVEIREALTRAARAEHRIAVAHLVDRLPTRAPTPPPRHCELCEGTGWIEAPPERAGSSGHGVDPCRCTTGQHLAQRWGMTVYSADTELVDDEPRLQF